MNGIDHGVRSERFSISNGTSDVAKKEANGMSIHKDTAQLKRKLCIGSNNDNHAARSLSTTVTNDMRNNIQGIPNKVEALANGNMVRAPASSISKACNSAPGVIEKDHSAKVQTSGAFSLFNDHMGNNNVYVLNNGKVQMNGDTNGLSPRSQAKACTLGSAEKKLHLPNDMQVAENSCLTEKKMRAEILHYEISGNGSVKSIFPTSLEEADAKVDKLQRQEKQAALSSREKAMFSLPLSSSTSFEMPVPRWEEDAEKSTGNTMEEQNLMAETVAHCGHVLDEWDEEYDQGKRKKLRRREGGKHEIAEVSGSLHIHKKRKKVFPLPWEHSSTAAPTSNGDCHGNAFQVFAGKGVQPTARLKKSRKRQRGLGHKLFLKRRRFKQLHTNRPPRRKG